MQSELWQESTLRLDARMREGGRYKKPNQPPESNKIERRERERERKYVKIADKNKYVTHRYKTLLRTACCTATMVDGGSALVVGGSFLSLRASSREGNSVRMERVGGERVEMDANGVVHLHFCHFPLPPPQKNNTTFFLKD